MNIHIRSLVSCSFAESWIAKQNNTAEMSTTTTTSDFRLNITESWRTQLGTDGLDEVAFGGVVLRDGDVILAGSSAAPGEVVPDEAFAAQNGSGNFVAFRLDTSSGEQLWRWGGSTGVATGDLLFAAGAAGVPDADGTGGKEFVVLAGSSEGGWSSGATDNGTENGNAQIAAVKLDASTGEEIWRFQDVPEDGGVLGGGTGSVLGVAGDPEGNFFLVGFVVGKLTSAAGIAGDRDYFVIKLDAATGNVLWRLQSGTPSEDDVLHAAVTDSSGNLIAAGYTAGDFGSADDAGGGHDYIAVKFSPDGEELWRYQSGAEQDEAFRAVDVDGDGNVYLGGGFRISEPQTVDAHQPTVHKLDGATGEPVWTYDGQTSTNTTFRSISVDESTGLVVCAGATDGGWARESKLRGGDDFALALVKSDTGEQFGRWHGGSDTNDAFTFAGVGPDGSVTLTGYTYGDWDGSGDGNGADFAAVKFPPLDRELIAPSVPTPASTQAPALVEAISSIEPTPSPTPGLRSTQGPASFAVVNGTDRSVASTEETGDDTWMVPVTVLGVVVGVLLLCELFVAVACLG